MPTIINNSQHYCTLINVFTTTPDKQQALADALREGTEKAMSKLPGYISANLHVGDDQKTVTNYAQWATLEDYQNALRDETARQHMQQAAALTAEFRAVTYNSIWSHSLDGKQG